MDGTDIESLKQVLMQLATVAQQLDRRSELAVQHVDASTTALDRSVRMLGEDAERFVRDAMRIMGDAARLAVAQGAGGALAEFKQRLQSSADTAQRAAQAMEQQRDALAAARHTLVWNGLGALLIGALLATGTAGYVGWKTVQEVEGAQFGQDILRATQNGSLTRCGGSLCVKAGKQPQRYAEDPGYLLLPE